MLEPYFIQPLGLVVEAPVLKEHGVDMCVVGMDMGFEVLVC